MMDSDDTRSSVSSETPVDNPSELYDLVCASKDEFARNLSRWAELLDRFALSSSSNESGDATTPPPHSIVGGVSFDRPTPAKVWGIGLLFVTIISGCAAAGIVLMPMLSRRTYRRLLIYLIGLGVGSLSGSAVFHLLPQGWSLVDPEGSSHEYLSSAWMTIFGIYMFFLIDKLMKIFFEFRKRRRSKGTYSNQLNNRIDGPDWCGETPVTEMSAVVHHANSAVDGHARIDSSVVVVPGGGGGSCQCHVDRLVAGQPHSESGGGVVVLEQCSMNSLAKVGNTTVDVLKEVQRMCSHDDEVRFEKGQSVIGTVAWMIIFGDGLHNFIDGLSIGAAFTDSILSGINVAVAVFCEEFPHELGDVAILVSAGMTLRQALLYNLLSAATCYLGFVLGVIVGELAAANTFIFALAGGMFLYISLGSMAPEMNTMLEKSLHVSTRQGILVLLLQSLGVFSGLILMFVMSRYGPEIQFG